MKFDITGSIVLYRNNRELLKNAIYSFLQNKLNSKLYLIDNSPTNELKDLISDSRIVYIFNNENVGFGKGHNIAINKAKLESEFHLVLNPDIIFAENVLEEIVSYMKNNIDVGVVMPKILNEDGSIQYVAKLLPTPFDFIIRRFLPRKVFSKLNIGARFELRDSGYNRIMEVPFLSGCFLVFNLKVLEKIGGFDENIFMYTEDIDITRRIFSKYRTIFYPHVHVHHLHERKSFRSFKVFYIYFKSAVYYFNKWGWFFDEERKSINNKTLSQFKHD